MLCDPNRLTQRTSDRVFCQELSAPLAVRGSGRAPSSFRSSRQDGAEIKAASPDRNSVSLGSPSDSMRLIKALCGFGLRLKLRKLTQLSCHLAQLVACGAG